MVSFMEPSTILVEIEGVVNSRPLTYVYDDAEGISFPLTLSHLLNGRNLLQERNDRFAEIVSTYEMKHFLRHELPLSFYQAETSTKIDMNMKQNVGNKNKVLRSRQQFNIKLKQS